MPKFTGKLCFDVEIEECNSREEVNKLGMLVIEAVNKIKGVDSVDQVDEDIDEEDDEETE